MFLATDIKNVGPCAGFTFALNRVCDVKNEAIDHMTSPEQMILSVVPEISRVVAHYFKTEDSREDMLQDVLTHLMLKHHSFKGKSPFSHWALKITSNLCISKLRYQKLRKYVSLDTQLEVEQESLKPGQEEEVQANESKRILHECLNMLKSRQREILMLSDILQKSDEEVASILSISSTNVRVRRHRARQKLKEILITRGYSHE